MSTVDVRIKRHAAMLRGLQDALNKQRLDMLRYDLRDEMQNMLGRCESSGPEAKAQPAVWLHGKTFDATYRDYGPKSKRYRTKQRFEALLDICQGDEKLLLTEYTLLLALYFPIESQYFSWAPRLLKTEAGHLTMIYSWRRCNKV